MSKIRNTAPARLLSQPSIPYQMNLMFDTIELQGMSAAQRAKAITQLAKLLMQASSIVTTKGHDHDER